MPTVKITRQDLTDDRQGRTFADVLGDPEQPLDDLLVFLSDENRQRRMEESETHHDRPPLAGVVRDLESQPAIDRFLGTLHPARTKRFRQAVGVIVRIIMERRGWRKIGKKGSLGVRAAAKPDGTGAVARHNTGGLAFWFLRAERYALPAGMPYRSVRERRKELDSQTRQVAPSKPRSTAKPGRSKPSNANLQLRDKP